MEPLLAFGPPPGWGVHVQVFTTQIVDSFEETLLSRNVPLVI